VRISRKLILLIEILLICGVLGTGISAGIVATSSVQQRTEDQLHSITILKVNQLNNFINERKEDVKVLTDSISAYMQSMPGTTRLNGFLYNTSLSYQYFFEFFIIEPDGKITASTDSMQIGKSKKTEDYFLSGFSDIYVQGFYYDQSLQEVALTVSNPIYLNNGSLIGVFAARVNIDYVSALLTERIGLGTSGETYLVNNFNYAVTQLREDDSYSFTKTIYSDIVEQCLTDKNEEVNILSDYSNYANVDVIGASNYVPDLNVCIIAELSEQEAFSSLIFFRDTLVIILLSLICSFIPLGYIVSKSITEPIKQLDEITKHISTGDLDAEMNVESNDEIGELAASFTIMRDSLKKTQQGLKDYTYVVSHDLKEPLRSLRFFSKFIIEKNNNLDPETKDALERINKAGNRMNELVDDLLKLSRIGRNDTEFYETDLNDIIDEVQVDLIGLIKKKNAKIHVKKLPIITANRTMMTELFKNLITNAIKFNESNVPSVKIWSERIDDGYLFHVSDNGIGIDNKYLEKIFGIFAQLNSREKYGGTGAGLTICKKIVEEYGGIIYAESKGLEKGSTFSFTIPDDISKSGLKKVKR